MQLKLIEAERLGYSSDYEINRSIQDLTRRLVSSGQYWRVSGNIKKKEMGLLLETEICYLQREIMWRRRRETHHSEYVKNYSR